MLLKSKVHFTHTQMIIALASIAALAILLPIAIPYWLSATVGSQDREVGGDRGCFFVRGRNGPNAAGLHYVTSTVSPNFIHSDASTSFVVRMWSDHDCRLYGARSYTPIGRIRCQLFAPDFDAVQYGTDLYTFSGATHSCSWLIAPKHQGRALIVASFLFANGQSLMAYREMKVADTPFSLGNISTVLGVLTAAFAFFAAIRGPSEAKKSGADR